MLAIRNNLMAVGASRYLGQSYNALAQSVERLSSGLRINSAKDDAAGMAVREGMRSDIAVLQQGSRNAQDGISMLQTMEGAMATIDTSLVRMRQLSEQASTGSYSSDQRQIMNSEFVEMGDEIERIANSTKFNDIAMLNNTTGVSIRFGSGSNDAISVTGADMTKAGLGITTGSAGYQAVSDTGVAAVGSGTFLTLTNTNAGGDNPGSVTLKIQFTGASANEDQITVTLSVAQNTTKNFTMQDVIDAINAQAENLGNDASGDSKNYAMASAVYDSGTNQYYLKIGSRTTAANGMTMTAATSTNTALSGAFTLARNTAATDITETDVTPYDADGKMNKQAGTGINILTAQAAQTALASITTAIGLKDAARSMFGYKINRLESTGDVLGIQTENLQTAESRISDVDVATEMATLTRNQVLAQAGTSMLAQANSIPQMALTLLR